jgi:hypothetical protein
MVLAAATVCGIIGAGGAALRGTRRADRLPVWLGYGLLIVSVVLLISHPLLVRYAWPRCCSNSPGPLCCPLFSPALPGWITTVA